MNDGMYTNIRNYLEEIASQQRQILAEQKRTNELLAGVEVAATAPPDDLPWPNYDSMNVADVVAKAKEVDDVTRAKALAYERKNKKRAGVIEPLVNWNS